MTKPTKPVTKPAAKSRSSKPAPLPYKEASDSTHEEAVSSLAEATPAAAPGPTISLPAPPPLNTIPSPPQGFVPTSGADYRGVVPRVSEQAVLGAAINDLLNLPNYASLVGAPPQAQLAELLTRGMQWTEMRNASSSWDDFARTQEGIVWTQGRVGLEKFKAPFALMLANDKTVAAQHPALVTLVGARSAIAQKGVSTKRANKKNQAQGKPQTHGAVGKQRQRSAAKAALIQVEQQQGGASGEATTNGANGAAPASNGATASTGANGVAKS